MTTCLHKGIFNLQTDQQAFNQVIKQELTLVQYFFKEAYNSLNRNTFVNRTCTIKFSAAPLGLWNTFSVSNDFWNWALEGNNVELRAESIMFSQSLVHIVAILTISTLLCTLFCRSKRKNPTKQKLQSMFIEKFAHKTTRFQLFFWI